MTAFINWSEHYYSVVLLMGPHLEPRWATEAPGPNHTWGPVTTTLPWSPHHSFQPGVTLKDA